MITIPERSSVTSLCGMSLSELYTVLTMEQHLAHSQLLSAGPCNSPKPFKQDGSIFIPLSLTGTRESTFNLPPRERSPTGSDTVSSTWTVQKTVSPRHSPGDLKALSVSFAPEEPSSLLGKFLLQRYCFKYTTQLYFKFLQAALHLLACGKSGTLSGSKYPMTNPSPYLGS